MNNLIYLLTHRHFFPEADRVDAHPPFEDGEPLFWNDSEENFKILGLYSSRERAEARIEAARSEPGFRSAPDGFLIHEYTVDAPRWTRGFRLEPVQDWEN